MLFAYLALSSERGVRAWLSLSVGQPETTAFGWEFQEHVSNVLTVRYEEGVRDACRNVNDVAREEWVNLAAR